MEWLDLVALEYAVECSGVTDFVLTKADVLSGAERVKIATAYSIDGKIRERVSSRGGISSGQNPCTKKSRAGRRIGDKNFERFISIIEKRIGLRIFMVSTGPDTDQMVGR